jgi:hypothetical protein
MRLVRLGGIALLAFALMPPTAYAQASQAGLSGRVIDRNGNGIAGALVLATVQEATRRAVTDESGSFAFVELEPGRYEVVARAVGYLPATRIVDLPSVESTCEVRLERQATDAREGDPGSTFTKSITNHLSGSLGWASATLGSWTLPFKLPTIQLNYGRTITTSSFMAGGSVFTSNTYATGAGKR